ncbi:SH3 domain-containing C40 family peptidase [soil metagenome]
MQLIDRMEEILEDVRREHAPDFRTSVFEIGVSHDHHGITLVGETSVPGAAEEIHRRVATLSPSLRVTDRVERLPSRAQSERSHALVAAAVAPMLAGPLITDSHISQSLAGHRLLILRERGRWLHCRSRDGYLGWVHRGYVRRVDEAEARQWEMGLGGESCFSLDAQLIDGVGEVAAMLPWGSRFVRLADGTALLQDGRTGILKGEWISDQDRPSRFPARGAAIVGTAALWLAAPYLWGGVTRAGVDCSGLAQAVYRTHGIELPRDSDQQALCGTAVDPGRNFENVESGDLLFFAEEQGRVTHVTFSEGGARIIHSSLGNGGVARNDLVGDLNYEKELRRIFVCARRILTREV